MLHHQRNLSAHMKNGTVRYAINEDKIIAWKKMNADAVALEITDRRN